jgi:hypothetical protein
MLGHKDFKKTLIEEGSREEIFSALRLAETKLENTRS